MSPELRTLAKEAPALGTAQRVQLAAVRIDSVEGPADLDWETAWVAGLDRRLANTERTGERGQPWEKMRARLRSRLADR